MNIWILVVAWVTLGGRQDYIGLYYPDELSCRRAIATMSVSDSLKPGMVFECEEKKVKQRTR